MDVFDGWMSQGQKLGLTDQKLIDYVQQCEERAQRQKEREVDREEKQKILEKEMEMEMAEKQRKIDMEMAEKQRKIDMEMAEKQRNLEMAERQKERDAAEKDKQRQHEIEMKKLELEAANRADQSDEEPMDRQAGSKGSGLKSTYIPKLPAFDEKNDEIDSFLFRFETHAVSCGWTKDKWPLYVASLFRGSALSLFHSLSAKQTISWDDLKTELLRKFRCTEEGFRAKFRSVRPETDESFAAFLIRAGHHLDRWIELSGITLDFQDLRDLLLREQILQSVSLDLMTFLRERKIESAEEMCELADQYKSAHPHKSVARKSQAQVFDANVGHTQQNFGSFHSGPFQPGNRGNFLVVVHNMVVGET